MLAATPAPLGQRHVPVISSSQRPAQRGRFPRLPQDTSCVISSRAEPAHPAPKTRRACAAAVPQRLSTGCKHSRRPKVTPWCSRDSAGLCFSGHLNLIYFPDGFPGFPLLPQGRERAGAVRIQPRSHGLWHPQLTGTERVFILWPPLATLHPSKDLPFVFYGSKSGQQLCCSSQNPVMCRDHLSGDNEQTPSGNGDTIPGQALS